MIVWGILGSQLCPLTYPVISCGCLRSKQPHSQRKGANDGERLGSHRSPERSLGQRD